MDTPLILMLLLGAVALFTPVLEGIFKGEMRGKFSGHLAVATLLLAILLVIYQPLTSPLDLTASSSGLFRNDLMGLFFALAVLIVALLVAVSSLDYMRGEPNEPVYYSLLLFSALGMSLLAFSVDLIMIAVAWELMSIPTYILTGFRKKDSKSNEGALKFFIMGALSSGTILYGISLIYGLTGSTNLFQIAEATSTITTGLYPVALLAMLLLIAGFGLKMSIVPFHMWIPDAYEGAPTTISALLSAGTKKAAFVVAIRVFVIALPVLQLNWELTFAFLALITMTLGNVAALTQKTITRLLAYSSIAQAGYILIGLTVALQTELGLIGVLFHVFTHAVMQTGAFLAAAVVAKKIGRTHLDSYNGLGVRMPITAFTFTISLLALAGVPPLNGFWSKLVLFTAAIDGGYTWLAVAGVLNSAFSLGYYAWIIKRMYIDEGETVSRVHEPIAFNMVLLSAMGIIVVTGIYPAPIYEFARLAVAALGIV
ncbi:MAG: NADH-quinone oxidoreductase subunit N [Nitrososphaerales archaeon]